MLGQRGDRNARSPHPTERILLLQGHFRNLLPIIFLPNDVEHPLGEYAASNQKEAY
jgi:hypothetical protein